MKAIRVHEFGDPEVMRLEETEDPVPGPGEVVVRIHAAGVNPVDTYIRSGAYANKPPLPYTPGADGAGVVEAVGEGVTDLRPGDRVYTSTPLTGTYAELCRLKARDARRLPDNVDFARGAGVNIPYATAYHALFGRAQAKPGETVLVHGASGGGGIAAVQIAVAHGLTVVGTAGTEAGMELVRAQGAHHVLNHREEDYLDQIKPLTGGHGVDIVLEMLANVNLDRDLDVLALRGRVAVIGNRGRIEIDPRKAMARDLTILGVLLGHASPQELRGIHAALYAGLANGTLRPVVQQELPLAEAPEAHRLVMESGSAGKIVLLPEASV